ncbi:hypothetical protein SRB5_16040 [Streptomyces sp. RB5]|uniref:Uncharacterized protein n=1 Tax=Streptomyces smaragdinus TaxID=2585196 RepID=A0A7K0CDD7_9ACTN|nr:hypothetical protein [Streptomyces smaragdinus]MQY11485.1 hypothetical protein [Streptomyces smaragdinus]
MTNPIPTWWVIYQEPNPASMEVVAVEPAPDNADAEDERCAGLSAAGQHAYVITASDPASAHNIALEVWARELAISPSRLAAATAYIDSIRACQRPNGHDQHRRPSTTQE